MEITKCSLCFVKYSPKEHSSEGTIKSEYVLEQNNIFGAIEDDPIKNQLKIIFLLRKILEIPQDKCCDFLVDYGDPCLWITCCPSCSDLVEKGKLIFDQMTLLQSQFRRLRNEIKRTIILSACEKEAKEDECKWGVQETVRSFLSQGPTDFKITLRNEDTTKRTFSPDLNDTSSEQANDLPEPSSLISDFAESHWMETEDQSSAYRSFEPDKDAFISKDPLALDENDGFEMENFVNISDIKKETESCYLIVNEGMISNDDIYPPEGGKVVTCLNSIPQQVNTHTVDKPYQCGFCEKRFAHSSNFKVHERTHTGEKPYRCRFCEKQFTHGGTLKSHERTHTGEKPFQCGFCEKNFANEKGLRHHEKIHTKEKLYKCDICEKGFVYKSDLNNHERIHTGEKPFQCGFCGKKFAHCSNFKVHERTHSGQKPYQCRFCDKKFTHANNLKGHEGIHTGEKPYQCKFCEKCFTNVNGLRKHKRTHTL